MTEVEVNYNFNISEISANMEAEGFQAAEVEAVMMANKDDTIWNALEGFDGKEDVCDEELVAAIGYEENDMRVGAGFGGPRHGRGRIPRPKPVKPTDHHLIKIAQFAVSKHNEEAGTCDVFLRVVSGVKWSIIAGHVYTLIIAIHNQRGIHFNKALVVDPIIGHKKLIWYKN